VSILGSQARDDTHRTNEVTALRHIAHTFCTDRAGDMMTGQMKPSDVGYVRATLPEQIRLRKAFGVRDQPCVCVVYGGGVRPRRGQWAATERETRVDVIADSRAASAQIASSKDCI